MESPLREGGRQPGLRLIETLLWDGAAFPHLPLHQARLQDGAAALGWPAPPALAPTVAGTAPARAARVRLTLDCAGAVTCEVGPLPQPIREWRLGPAPERLRSTDPWLGVKSTHRAAYDRARATLPPGLDEVIFLNERGEVCDGTITTLFFDRGAGLRTPPLTAGLLPGVLRRALSAPEETLVAPDLPQVRLWVGNALRGLIPARWIG